MSSASRAIWPRLEAHILSPHTPCTRAPPHPRPRPSSPVLLRRRPPLHPPPPQPRNSRQPFHQSARLRSPPHSFSSAARKQTQRLHAILERAGKWVPRRLRPYLSRLRSAPLSHVAAFLALHEVTAVAPLLGLTYWFYTADVVPTAWVLGPWAAGAEEGLRRWVRYFRRKGWFGLGEGDGDGEERLEEQLREEVERERRREREEHEGRGGSWNWSWLGWRRRTTTRSRDGDGEEADLGGAEGEKTTAWKKAGMAATLDNTEKGYKIGVQIAAAYVITKMLLVPRIAFSLWATPWLARGFVAARRSLWRKRS
ncbi:hypothetical protein AAE478_004419 [Parahypoxylon ruwenzoriense]